MMSRVLFAALLLAAGTGCAFAGDTLVSAAPLVDLVTPWITAAASGAVLAFLTWLAGALRTRFGIDLDQRHRDALHLALTTGVTSGLRRRHRRAVDDHPGSRRARTRPAHRRSPHSHVQGTMIMWGWLKGWFREADADADPAGADPAGATVTDDDSGWRPLSSTKRDLNPVTQRRMQELAHHAWEQHRLANRLVELPLAFILGDGVSVTCDNEQAQSWLKEWWCDPINRFDLNLEKRVRELALFGEQVIVVFTTAAGLVRHGAIDPTRISRVVIDPDNAALPIGVEVGCEGADLKTYRVILEGRDDDILTPAAIALRAAMTAGDCHFWRVNDLLTGTRGRSDLLSAIDIADAYTQLIFGEVERAAALRTAIWDVTVTGATPEQIAERAASIAPPRPMSVRVHNEAEKWESISPKLEAADASETLRVVRNEVLGGGTIPEHWYGGGGDVNRATAAEMDEPTYKIFRRRQLLWQAIIEAEARHAIRQRLRATGQDASVLPDDMMPRAEFPEMQSVDVSRYAQALAQVVAAAASAVDRGLLSEETAVQLIASIAGKLGVEIDAGAELEAARVARDKRQADDVFRPPPAAAADPADDLPPESPMPADGAAGTAVPRAD
ncbi:hypothetical protein [Ancylobacter lacus]|uniref:hypothetical protein n=1 Tax=Ancylobacter lacus TaxID=2579970 RepID=UPI001BCB29E2|nr:hypothetical protein [Ancylobacter lacus]MBS7539752.1 hypothetical protein [Ancylobacter lacus]